MFLHCWTVGGAKPGQKDALPAAHQTALAWVPAPQEELQLVQFPGNHCGMHLGSGASQSPEAPQRKLSPLLAKPSAHGTGHGGTDHVRPAQRLGDHPAAAQVTLLAVPQAGKALCLTYTCGKAASCTVVVLPSTAAKPALRAVCVGSIAEGAPKRVAALVASFSEAFVHSGAGIKATAAS